MVSGARGLDLVRELREKGALAPAVAVAVTADGETCRRARAAGFDDVLANSVPPAQFAATILGVLRK
jgi:CheY-like chemotaxis protein